MCAVYILNISLYVIDNVWVARLCSPAGKDEHKLQMPSWYQTSFSSVPSLRWSYLKLIESNHKQWGHSNSQPLRVHGCVTTIKRAARPFIAYGFCLVLAQNYILTRNWESNGTEWERCIVLLLYRMTPEMFVSHSHSGLFVQLAHVAISVACFC